MPLNFPSSPSLNLRYTYNGKTFIWKGSYWAVVGANPQDVYVKTDFTATSGQTTFTVAYTIGYVDVWLNGVKLIGDGTDYTATNGTSIVLTTGATLNDEVQVIAWNPIALNNGSLTDVTLIGSVTETVFALTDATTVDIDPADGTIQTLELTGTGRTLTFTNMANGQAITLMVNDGTDGTITTWNATFVNNGGSAPTLATTGYTVVSVWKAGGTVYGALVGDGS